MMARKRFDLCEYTVLERRCLDSLSMQGYVVGSCEKCRYFAEQDDTEQGKDGEPLPDRCCVNEFYLKVSRGSRCKLYRPKSYPCDPRWPLT